MKRIPMNRPLAGKQKPGGFDEEGFGPGLVETNVDYLNKHAEEWKPLLGRDLHLHLMTVHSRVYWQVAERGSIVCKVPGRCLRVDMFPSGRIV